MTLLEELFESNRKMTKSRGRKEFFDPHITIGDINSKNDLDLDSDVNADADVDAEVKDTSVGAAGGSGGDIKSKNKEDLDESLEDAGRNQMTIYVRQGVNSSGFKVTITDSEGREVFSQRYDYGYNASYKRSHARYAHDDVENAKKYNWKGHYAEKPYVSDIIDDLCREYHVDKKDVQVVAGDNVFRRDKVDDSDVKDFVDKYINGNDKDLDESFDYDEYSEEDRELYDYLCQSVEIMFDDLAKDLNLNRDYMSQYSRYNDIIEDLVYIVKASRAAKD